MSFINKAVRAVIYGLLGPINQRNYGGGGHLSDPDGIGLLTTSVTEGIDGYQQVYHYDGAIIPIVGIGPVDGLANPVAANGQALLGTANFLMGYDGVGAWDRLRTTGPGTGILQVATTGTAPPSFTNSQITVTNVSQVFSAANPARKYLLIQNNDTAGIIYVAFGAVATSLNGVKILPGGYYELNTTVPNNSVNIIGSIAANANCVLVEA
jgi:hypothetical protein